MLDPWGQKVQVERFPSRLAKYRVWRLIGTGGL